MSGKEWLSALSVGKRTKYLSTSSYWVKHGTFCVLILFKPHKLLVWGCFHGDMQRSHVCCFQTVSLEKPAVASTQLTLKTEPWEHAVCVRLAAGFVPRVVFAHMVWSAGVA